jgi:hypothetical protein
MHKQVDSNDSCKVKNIKWGGMHRCLPLLKNERKLVFLRFTIVNPQAPSWLFLIHVVTDPERNAMHDIKIERWGYNKEG